MYKCQICGVSSQPCERMQRVVTQTRDRSYGDDSGPRGSEIVEEKAVCGGCSTRLVQQAPSAVTGA